MQHISEPAFEELAHDLKHLRLLAKKYPNIASVSGEILHNEMLLSLPKGTEYFFSDLHGEDGAFIHLLRSASGTVRNKIGQVFDKMLSEDEQNHLALLVYNPEKILGDLDEQGQLTPDYIRLTLYRLVLLLRFCASKYPRFRVRKKTPPEYSNIISELLYNTVIQEDQERHYNAVVQAVLNSVDSKRFLAVLCLMIQNICVDTLHIIGDIFDRGPGPHRIIDELMTFPNVDMQWGNHDVVWMGAAAGSETCIANVVRVAIGYNGFDCLEDGYGINLRPLYSFANEVYKDDPCKRFMPKLLDENKYDQVNPEITAKMHKAISIIQFKLEGQLYKRHPEYELAHRIVLEKVDWETKEYVHEGQRFPLLDQNFPTINPKNPLELTPEEAALMHGLRASFLHSEALKRHINYLYAIGSTYTCINQNLLFHGCLPMTEDGEFDTANYLGRPLKGKALMDATFQAIRMAWFGERGTPERASAEDLLYYLWLGPKSPMFGKSKMATFENFFVEDKALRKEVYNPYYKVSQDEQVCMKIIREFKLDPQRAHIINGHVPVKIKDGETPVKANGKLFVIDGGIAKAYQPKTGIAGYTMIFNSHYLALVEHSRFEDIENDNGRYMPAIQVVEQMPQRVLIKDTNEGDRIRERLEDLKKLLKAYELGILRQSYKPLKMERL